MTNRLLGRTRVVALAVAVLAPMACPASADMIVNVSSAMVIPGQGGYLEIYFTNPTGGEALAAYQVALDVFKNAVGDQTDVKFSVLSNATTSPVFPSSTPYLYGGYTLPNTHLAAAADIPSGENVIAHNSSLIKIAFTTSVNSRGVYHVNFDTDPVLTNFTNGNGDDLAALGVISYTGGTIFFGPEPSTMVLSVMGLVGVFACARRKRS